MLFSLSIFNLHKNYTYKVSITHVNKICVWRCLIATDLTTESWNLQLLFKMSSFCYFIYFQYFINLFILEYSESKWVSVKKYFYLL